MSTLSTARNVFAIFLITNLALAQEPITVDVWRSQLYTEVRQQVRESNSEFFKLVLYSESFRDERLRELSTLSKNEQHFEWKLQQNFVADLLVGIGRPEYIDVVAEYFGSNQQVSSDEIADEEIVSMLRPLMIPTDRTSDPNEIESLFDIRIERTSADRFSTRISDGCKTSIYVFQKKKGLSNEFWVPDPSLSRGGIC